MSTFSPEAFTLGVEEEYQLVDAETGELRSRARCVLEWDWTGEIQPEMQENTLEVGTRVCENAGCVRTELRRLRLLAAVAAEARGLRVVAAGLHPSAHWAGQEFTDRPVYQQIRREYRRLADSQMIFGMHVHVGVPAEVDRVQVMNVVRLYLPYLLALTASSPFFLGEDTGYASYRTILWRRWPRSGPPPRFGSRAEYEQLIEWLLRTGRIDATGRLYWDMRPHHTYPTLELRVADVTPRLEDAVVAAALVRVVVVGAIEGVLREPELPTSLLQTLLADNAWYAARDGLEAEFVDLTAATPRTLPAREALLGLAEQLAPLAQVLGDGEVLAGLPAVLERGGAAARIRAQHQRHGGDIPALMRWLADEALLGLGLDRRREQRENA
ncbi:carboxylate-amine ligase [soil metagenome]